MRRSEDFLMTVRRGRKVGGSSVVVHLLAHAGPNHADPAIGSPMVGFIVTKAVGPAVVRNRVKRQLRHLMRDRVDQLSSGARVVVRALPSSAKRGRTELATDLDRALSQFAA